MDGWRERRAGEGERGGLQNREGEGVSLCTSAHTAHRPGVEQEGLEDREGKEEVEAGER